MDRLLKTSGTLLAAALILWGAFPLWGGYEAARLAGSLGPFCVALIIASLWWAAAGLVGGVVVVLTRVEAHVADLRSQVAALRGRGMTLVASELELAGARRAERERRAA